MCHFVRYLELSAKSETHQMGRLRSGQHELSHESNWEKCRFGKICLKIYIAWQDRSRLSLQFSHWNEVWFQYEFKFAFVTLASHERPKGFLISDIEFAKKIKLICVQNKILSFLHGTLATDVKAHMP